MSCEIASLAVSRLRFGGDRAAEGPGGGTEATRAVALDDCCAAWRGDDSAPFPRYSALGTLAAGVGTLGSAIAAILALRAASAAAPATRSKPSGKKSAARRTKK